MSDYLRGLVTRVLVPGSVLQPRPVSMFEQYGGVATPEGRFADASEPVGQEPAARVPRPERSQMAAEPRVEARGELPAVESLTSIADAPRPELAMPEATRMIAPASLPVRVRSESVANTHAEPEALPESTPAPQAVAISRTATFAPSANPPVTLLAAPMPEPAVAVAQASLAPPPIAPRIASMPVAPRRLPVERLRRDRADAGSPAATPVEITIGRIDVRAVVANAPAPSPRARAKPQVLSLDDFLATREGGGG